MFPKKDMFNPYPRIPENVALFGKRIFADATKLRRGHKRLGWSLNPMTDVFIREGRERFGHRDTDKQKTRSYAMETESGLMELKVKGHQGLAPTKRS